MGKCKYMNCRWQQDYIYLWRNPSNPCIYKDLTAINEADGNNHHKYFMAGNAYSPINPYKQGLCRWHPINLYEFYTKTF